EALLNLGLSIALIGRYGILGVALGTAIPNIAMCLVVLTQVCRMLDVSLKTLFRESIRKPALAAAGLVPLWLVVGQVLAPIHRTNFAALIDLGVGGYVLEAAVR